MYKAKIRNSNFDQVAGICIVFMIFTHICQLSYQSGWPVYMKSLGIFYFYMYFFFLKSGIFFHEKSIKECIYNNARHLLKPYLVYMLIGHIVHCVSLCLKGNISLYDVLVQPWIEMYSWGASLGNLPLWFLLCLFLVKVSFNIMMIYRIKPFWVLLVSFSCATYLQHINMTINGYQIPYTIGAAMMAMAIYAFGFMTKDFFKSGGGLFTKVSFGLIFTLSIYIDSSSVEIRSNSCSSFCLPWFLFSYIACMFLLRIFDLKHLAIPLIEQIGRNSMTYYVWHWILLNITSILYYGLGGKNNKVLWGLMVMSCIVSLPLIQYIKTKNIIKT